MDKPDDKRRQIITEMLASTVPVDNAEVAARAAKVWGLLAKHFSPLIGDSGFNALYGRSLRLVHIQFDWLTAPKSSQSTKMLFATLTSNFLSVDAADANNASIALLDTFTKLLSGLIGEALTSRLLNTVLADEPEEKQK